MLIYNFVIKERKFRLTLAWVDIDRQRSVWGNIIINLLQSNLIEYIMLELFNIRFDYGFEVLTFEVDVNAKRSKL